jgi:uncharacterized iron-regulated membrane protein
MEDEWPVLIDAVVSAPPQERGRRFWTGLAIINGTWCGSTVVYMVWRWLLLAEPFELATMIFMFAYTLVPSLLIVPAYYLWRYKGGRPRQKPKPPLQLS